jgi:biotin carboxyl carrier protein
MTDKNISYKVKANEFEFSFSKEDIEDVDLIKRSNTNVNVITNNRSVNAEILNADPAAKKITVESDGEIFEVEIKDELDLVLEKMGFDKTSSKVIKDIKAPMPGLVLEISVTEGQEVAEGDKILILQAMKMENSIMTHTNAKIKRIAVKAGQAVEKGQVMVEFE